MGKIFVVCTGSDRIQRGGEVYARDLFESLTADGRHEVFLVKGGGRAAARELRIPCIHRNAWIASVLGRLVRKSSLWVEYATFLPLLLIAALILQPQAIYCVEHAIFRSLVRLRAFCPRARLITHSGVQVSRLPSDANTRFHYVTGEFQTPDGQTLSVKPGDVVVPHFIPRDVLTHIADADRAVLRRWVRDRYDVSTNHQVLISVGSLDESVKRMLWLAREVAELPGLFLLMVGAESPETATLKAECARLLPGRHAFDVGTRHQVLDLMLGSDAYVSASLREGFGLANLEAAFCGLPVIVHPIPEVKWVLGDYPTYGDLTRKSVLSTLIHDAFARQAEHGEMRHHLDRFREEAVIPQFEQLFN